MFKKGDNKTSTELFNTWDNKQNFITLNKTPKNQPNSLKTTIRPFQQHSILHQKMPQMHHSGSENEFQPKKLHYLAIMDNMLKENTNHPSIKEKVKRKIQRVQGLTYSALVESEQKYVQKMGMFTQNQQLFVFIGKLMNGKEQNFFNEYHRGDFSIKSNIKPPPEPEAQPPQEIVKQVQYVLSHVDLPLSLFKRNDNYWSIDNPKTKEAKEYLKKMRQQDQQFKLEMKKKREQILNEKQQMRSKTFQVIKKQEESHKQETQQKILKKIQELKQNDQNRKKAISESVEFMKERGVPLFKKIQKDFKQKIQIPSIEQKKRKLSQLRQMMRSVPLQQIQQHRERYQKQKSQHQQRTIVNQPLSISFKSHFYQEIKSMSVSRFNQMQSNLSLYQKRLEYAKIVKENHKPAIDETKKEEIYSRIKLMNKRRARVKKSKKPTKNSDQDEDEEDVEEEEEQEEEEPEPQENSDDDSDKPKPQKDDQYEPTNKERYKMGLNYLKVARKLADTTKKANTQQTLKPGTTTNRAPTATQNQTISFGNNLDNKEGQETVDPTSGKKPKFVWVSKYDEEEKRQERIIYKNYLKEISKGNQSVDTIIDTSRIKKEIQKNLAPGTERSRTRSRLERSRKAPDIEAQIMYHTNLENKIRNIQQRAKNQEQLLKFKRINKTQKIKKKMAIDDAVVDTIKARLLMMNKTLDV